MRVLPRSPIRRAVVGVVLVAILVAGALNWDNIVFGVKLIFPGRAYTAAERRTTGAADLAEHEVPLPAVLDAPRPPGGDPSVSLRTIVEIDLPSALADPPGDGPVLVSTLDGRVYSLDLVSGTLELVLDLRGDVSTGGERGLLGIAVDPAGERLFVDYTNGKGDNEIRSWRLDGAPLGDEGTFHMKIGQPFENHNGGNLVFGPDGALWIGTGDGGGAGDRGDVAQNVNRVLGKMLRVVPDAKGGLLAPSSNPEWDGRPEVWAIGLRNPWRYSFDMATNRLWVADVGQNSIEEVSVVDPTEPKPDFGWNTVEGNNDYEGEPSAAFIAPVVEYGHEDGCSITGGYVYRGGAIEGLYGWYLFADYCSGWIRAVPSDDPEQSAVEIATGIGPVISFGELESGELVVLTAEEIYAIETGAPPGP